MTDFRDNDRNTRIALLMAGGPLGNIAANHLLKQFPGLRIIREQPESKSVIIKRRTRLLGPVQAAGQAAGGIVYRFIAKASRERVAEICTTHNMDPSEPDADRIVDVTSVNTAACRQALEEFDPAVVAVYGTRILGARTLGCIEVPFINYHAGINPKYRGQHPGYWARANGDTENIGVTIHLVDSGVDTGDVLAQERVHLDAADNICTYQHVQMATALPLFTTCLKDALRGELNRHRVDLPSGLYFPPTIWRYAWNGVSRGVW